MKLTPDEIIHIMQIARYDAYQKKMGYTEKTKLISNYKHQLAELDKQYWFEQMPEQEYIERFDEIKERLNRLEEEDD